MQRTKKRYRARWHSVRTDGPSTDGGTVAGSMIVLLPYKRTARVTTWGPGSCRGPGVRDESCTNDLLTFTCVPSVGGVDPWKKGPPPGVFDRTLFR